MHSNFELLSFILKATPINPRAESGAIGRSLLIRLTSIVPFLNSISFILTKVGSSTAFTEGSFMTFTTSLPINLSIDIATLTASSLFLFNLTDCEYKLIAPMRQQLINVNFALFIFLPGFITILGFSCVAHFCVQFSIHQWSGLKPDQLFSLTPALRLGLGRHIILDF